MARYDKNENTLTFTGEESEREYCPSCMAGLDLMPPAVEDGEMVRVWDCPACGLKGKVYSSPRFDRHVVDLSGMNRAELLSNNTHCLNGVISIGDYVLSVADNIIPCLPGQVIAIDLADTENCGSDSRQDNVHVDFSVFSDEFSEKRKQEAAEFYGKIQRKRGSFQQADYENVIINPDSPILSSAPPSCGALPAFTLFFQLFHGFPHCSALLLPVLFRAFCNSPFIKNIILSVAQKEKAVITGRDTSIVCHVSSFSDPTHRGFAQPNWKLPCSFRFRHR